MMVRFFSSPWSLILDIPNHSISEKGITNADRLAYILSFFLSKEVVDHINYDVVTSKLVYGCLWMTSTLG